MSALLDLDLLRLQWQKHRAFRALPCMVPIACSLALGLVYGDARAGMVAASGAFAVGLGSFQWLGKSRVAPMLGATLGMAAAALAGSLVGHRGSPGAVLNATWAGFGAGMLLTLGPGSTWIGQQCAILALVASGYPVGMGEAFARAGLILAGGILQTLFMLGVWRLRFPAGAAEEEDPFEGFLPAVRTLRAHLTPRSETFRYAIRQGLTLGVGAELAHLTGLSNGYWVPMTALLVLKPDFRQTFRRGLERVAGTLGGAALATLLVHFLRLDPLTMGCLIVLFAWLGYALINVNYAVYAVFLTAYIVFLLDFGGLSTSVVVLHRALNTALGGGLALLSYVTVLGSRKWEVGSKRLTDQPDPASLSEFRVPTSDFRLHFMPTDWESCYRTGETPWDKGSPAPPLLEWLAQPGHRLEGEVLVPGCGLGHDVRAIAATGQASQVIGLDVSPAALVLARQQPPAGSESYVEADLFDLPPTLRGRFDWVVEHTCFCAIDPKRRADYVQAVAGALKPGGHLLAIFYLNPWSGGEQPPPGGGPPFPTSVEELDHLFSGKFELSEEAIPTRAYRGREGRELRRLLQRPV